MFYNLNCVFLPEQVLWNALVVKVNFVNRDVRAEQHTCLGPDTANTKIVDQ